MTDEGSKPKWRRVVIKLSGEALQGSQSHGLDPTVVDAIAGDLARAAALGIEVVVVVGGGNFFRGIQGRTRGSSARAPIPSACWPR